MTLAKKNVDVYVISSRNTSISNRRDFSDMFHIFFSACFDIIVFFAGFEEILLNGLTYI